MAPTACESGSQEVEVSDARGSKKGGAGSNFDPRGSNFASQMVPDGLLEPSWGVLGARSSSAGLWADKGELENCMEGS